MKQCQSQQFNGVITAQPIQTSKQDGVQKCRGRVKRHMAWSLAALGALSMAWPAAATESEHATSRYPVTTQQRAVAKQVAQAGIPISELAPNAPDSYKVKTGDTLWSISGLFLKRPWHWPELWGMNLQQIRNPHLIYPGQLLVLERNGDRARLRVGSEVVGPGKLSPRMRANGMFDAIGAIPLRLIEPFLNEAVIFDSESQLAQAPRIVGAPDGRVVLTRGDTAYVLGDRHGISDWRIFRTPKALTDPTTNEILGYEAVYVGQAEYVRSGIESPASEESPYQVADTYAITNSRLEAGLGDRLAEVPAREYARYVPHAPELPINGQIVAIYGDGLSAGQNQIVAINKGARDGIERGYVLALVTDGKERKDITDPLQPTIKLPNERSGLLFVFRVFDRISYALILRSQGPAQRGDRFVEP